MDQITNQQQAAAGSTAVSKLTDRIKKPWVIVGLAGLLYQALEKQGVAPPIGNYQLAIDILCYAILGFAVYSDHGTGKVK